MEGYGYLQGGDRLVRDERTLYTYKGRTRYDGGEQDGVPVALLQTDEGAWCVLPLRLLAGPQWRATDLTAMDLALRAQAVQR